MLNRQPPTQPAAPDLGSLAALAAGAVILLIVLGTMPHIFW